MSKQPSAKSKSAVFPKTAWAMRPEWGDGEGEPVFGTLKGLAMSRDEAGEFEVAEYKLVRVTRAITRVDLVE
jgi:hypothetical protein